MNNKSVGVYKIKAMFITIMMFLSANNLFAQAPGILWQKTFGKEGFNIFSQDIGYSIQQTIDGGYIITGIVYQAVTYADVWLIKTNANGDTLWTKTYGGNEFDRGWSVQQTTDGGYIIAGETHLASAPLALWLIKTDANGDSLWTKLYGAYGEGMIARSVQQTSDGGYIAAGQKSDEITGYYDVWLVKTDSYGDTLWTKTYGGDSLDQAWSVQQTTDGGYIITGRTYSFGPGNLSNYPNGYLIRTNVNGDSLWTRVYGGVNSDEFHSVKQSSDGGYIVTGWTKSFGAGGCDVWLIKTDTGGDTLWTKTYGGSSNDEGLSIQITSDGSYIISGWTILPGHTESDVYLIKIDAAGNLLWELTCGTTNGADNGQSVQQTTDGGYIITGQHSISMWDYDVFLIKTGPDLGIEENPITKPLLPYVGLKVFPNPFSNRTDITLSVVQNIDCVSGFRSLKIYNAMGFLVRDLSLYTTYSQCSTCISWDGSDDFGHKVPAGTYFIRLLTPEQRYIEKVILMR